LSGPVSFQGGAVYRFVFDGASITLTDQRPLVKAGETGWTRVFADAGTAVQLARNSGGGITAFSSGGSAGLERRDFSSGGEPVGPAARAERREPANIGVSGALKTEGGAAILWGWIEDGYSAFIPVLHERREDSGLAAALEPSGGNGPRSAYFLAAAEGEGGELIAAGGADSGINALDAYGAYARAVRHTPSGFAPLWELGSAEFDTAAGVRCGEIAAALFDRKRGVWAVAGKTIEYDAMKNPVAGSYIAYISRNGKIERVDTSYKGLLFNRIASDGEGAYYLAGEERAAGSSYATAVKLAPDGTEAWRGRNRPGADSFYQDFVFDADSGHLVLAGTLGAADSGGTGGTPFIEGVNAGTGELIWRRTLTDAPFRETALVTGIEKAPYYGFVLALSGVEDGYFAPPFMLARVNARGGL
jgi:hypothetical protein